MTTLNVTTLNDLPVLALKQGGRLPNWIRIVFDSTQNWCGEESRGTWGPMYNTAPTLSSEITHKKFVLLAEGQFPALMTFNAEKAAEHKMQQEQATADRKRKRDMRKRATKTLATLLTDLAKKGDVDEEVMEIFGPKVKKSKSSSPTSPETDNDSDTEDEDEA